VLTAHGVLKALLAVFAHKTILKPP
jgi:hypothetical protein